MSHGFEKLYDRRTGAYLYSHCIKKPLQIGLFLLVPFFSVVIFSLWILSPLLKLENEIAVFFAMVMGFGAFSLAAIIAKTLQSPPSLPSSARFFYQPDTLSNSEVKKRMRRK